MKEERQSEIERISNDITTTIVDHVMNHGMTQRDDMTSAEVFFCLCIGGRGCCFCKKIMMFYHLGQRISYLCEGFCKNSS